MQDPAQNKIKKLKQMTKYGEFMIFCQPFSIFWTNWHPSVEILVKKTC